MCCAWAELSLAWSFTEEINEARTSIHTQGLRVGGTPCTTTVASSSLTPSVYVRVCVNLHGHAW